MTARPRHRAAGSESRENYADHAERLAMLGAFLGEDDTISNGQLKPGHRKGEGRTSAFAVLRAIVRDPRRFTREQRQSALDTYKIVREEERSKTKEG